MCDDSKDSEDVVSDDAFDDFFDNDTLLVG